jgi:hypothetical protein
MKKLLSILLFCVLGSAGKIFALPPCPTSGVFDNCLGGWTYSNGQTYFGEWKDDKKYGQGYFTTPGGQTHLGEWKDDKRNGQGIATFPGGETYVGEWKDDVRYGQGRNLYSDGQTYVGEWKDDVRYGQGSATFSDGETYFGEWKDDKRNGQGSNIYSDGTTYVGEWRDDKQHGEGVKTNTASKEDGKQLKEVVKPDATIKFGDKSYFVINGEKVDFIDIMAEDPYDLNGKKFIYYGYISSYISETKRDEIWGYRFDTSVDEGSTYYEYSKSMGSGESIDLLAIARPNKQTDDEAKRARKSIFKFFNKAKGLKATVKISGTMKNWSNSGDLYLDMETHEIIDIAN